MLGKECFDLSWALADKGNPIVWPLLETERCVTILAALNAMWFVSNAVNVN